MRRAVQSHVMRFAKSTDEAKRFLLRAFFRLLPRVRSVSSALLPLLAACQAQDIPPVLGTLERDRLELIAEASEPIVEIAVEEGDRVEAGQLLVRLAEERLAAELHAAQAAVAEAQARYDELIAGPRREEIDEARAALAGAEARLVEARLDHRRQRDLAARKLQSQAALDAAKARLDSAAAEQQSARARLDLLLAGTRAEQLRQAAAQLSTLTARRDELQIRIKRLTVTSPVPGIVDALPYEIGERPPAGATLAVVLDRSRLYARVYLPVALRNRLAPAAAAEIRLPGNGPVLAGKVRWIAHDAAFTPFFALHQKDRGHLVYLAEIDVSAAPAETPLGTPVEVGFPGLDP